MEPPAAISERATGELVLGTLCLAPSLPSEQLEDIDPVAVLRVWHEKWCGLEHRGVRLTALATACRRIDEGQ